MTGLTRDDRDDNGRMGYLRMSRDDWDDYGCLG